MRCFFILNLPQGNLLLSVPYIHQLLKLINIILDNYFFHLSAPSYIQLQAAITLKRRTVKERTNVKEHRRQEWQVITIQKLPQWNQTTNLNQALWKKAIFYYIYNKKNLLFDSNLFSAPNLFLKSGFFKIICLFVFITKFKKQTMQYH